MSGSVVMWIRETDVEAYISQGWEVRRMFGHHGARPVGMKSWIAVLA